MNTGPESRLWRLEVTSFVGIGFGATHTYGVLMAPDTTVEHTDGEAYHVSGQRYDVLRVLDEESAAELNKVNGMWGRDHAIDNEAGDVTRQWDNEAQVEEAGLAAWRAVCDDPEAVLVRGRESILNPGKPLAGPEQLLQTLVEIWELDESEDGRSWTPTREEAHQRWDEAVKVLMIERDEAKHSFGPHAPDRPDDIDVQVTRVGDTYEATKMEDRW